MAGYCEAILGSIEIQWCRSISIIRIITKLASSTLGCIWEYAGDTLVFFFMSERKHRRNGDAQEVVSCKKKARPNWRGAFIAGTDSGFSPALIIGKSPNCVHSKMKTNTRPPYRLHSSPCRVLPPCVRTFCEHMWRFSFVTWFSCLTSFIEARAFHYSLSLTFRWDGRACCRFELVWHRPGWVGSSMGWQGKRLVSCSLWTG